MNILFALLGRNLLENRLPFLVMILGLLIVFSFGVLSSQQGQLKSTESQIETNSTTNLAANLIADTYKDFPKGKEDIEKRTRYSKTSLVGELEDGKEKYALDSSTVPVHYKDAIGVWREIDVALLPTDGEWDYSMEKADYSFFVKKIMNSEKLVEFQKNDEYVRFAPISLGYSGGKKVVPSQSIGDVKDNKVSWQNVFGIGTKLSWTALPERLDKILEVDEYSYLDSLGTGQSLELTLKFEYSDGVQAFINGKEWDGVQIETRDEVEFRDEQGDQIWSFREPTAWDSGNNYAEDNFFRIENVAGGFYVTHVIKTGWLKTAKYPVSIDVDLCSGGCAISPLTDDGIVWTPSNYDPNWSLGFAGNLSNGTVYGSYIRFGGISGLGSSTIDSAYLRVYGWKIDDLPTGDVRTAIFAEKRKNPVRVSSYNDFHNKLLTGEFLSLNNPSWTGSLTNITGLEDVVSEVAGLDPSAIQFLHFDTGSGVSGGNYLQYTSVNWAQAPRLHVEYSAAPDPDFFISRTFNGGLTNDIIANKYPPTSTSGNRLFYEDAAVRYHGWVRNPTGPAGNVNLCLQANRTTPPPDSTCSGGASSTSITATVPPGGWGSSVGGFPFGTACANVTGPDPGVVDLDDINAVIAHQSPLGGADPDYDINDDGVIDLFFDIMGAIDQFGVVCQRNVGFTTSSTQGVYDAYARVDRNNLIMESTESNNMSGPDEYEVVADPLRTLSLSIEPRISLEEGESRDTEFLATLDADVKPPGWNLDQTTLDLSITNVSLPGSTDANFGTGGSEGKNTSRVLSGPGYETIESIPYFVNVPAGTTAGFLGSFKIEVVASQEGPFFISSTESIVVEVAVVEKGAWFRTHEGDVAAQGDLINEPPLTTQTSIVNGAIGQMTHSLGCVFYTGVCYHPGQPSASIIAPLYPGQIGVRDLRPPNGNPANLTRLYLTFDTPAGFVQEATFSFDVSGLVHSPNTEFGIYNIPSISWTDPFTFDEENRRDDLWDDTTIEIHTNGVQPLYTFNTDDLPGQNQTYTFPPNVKGLVDDGGTTQWIVAWTGESTWDTSSTSPTYGTNYYTALKNPTLEVEAVLTSDVSATYLGIADKTITGFLSSVEWLVHPYDPPGLVTGLNYTFAGGIYDDLVTEFGAGAVDHTGGNLPDGSGTFIHSGSFTWSAVSQTGTSGDVVMFIDGDMTINKDLNLPSTKRVVFVVNGDITLDVGLPVDLIEGLFVSNGQFISGATPVDPGPSQSEPGNQLVVNGGIYAQGGIIFGRDLGDTNVTQPAEIINFDPSYLYLFARVGLSNTKGSLLGNSGTVIQELPP